MVKHGTCVIECTSCNYKRQDYESINSDYRSFRTKISENCGHFGFNVQVLTRNTFTPFGSPDEINYSIEVSCRYCNKTQRFTCWATSCSTNSLSWARICCGNRYNVGVWLTPNSFGDILSTTFSIFSALSVIQV